MPNAAQQLVVNKSQPQAGLAQQQAFCKFPVGFSTAELPFKQCVAMLRRIEALLRMHAGTSGSLTKVPSAESLKLAFPLQPSNFCRIPSLVEQLKSEDPVAKTGAAWALHDLAKGQPAKNTGQSFSHIKFQAIWEISNTGL